MYLYLVRHAIAFDRDPAQWPDDRDRPLTSDGIRKFRRAARGLAKIVPDVELVLSSPLTRTWQTAEILEDRADWPEPGRLEALEPGHDPAAVLYALEPHANLGTLALVGHDPSLPALVAHLVGADSAAERLEMRKGGVACLTLNSGFTAGTAVLRWWLT